MASVWPSVPAVFLLVGATLFADDSGRTGYEAPVGKERAVDCDRGQTINAALARLHAGRTLRITGKCVENVEIGERLHDVTLEGGGIASITGAVTTLDVIRIYADQVTVRGLTISGGRDGVNLRGANGVSIDSNVIENSANHGIDIHRNSWATVTNNLIRDNGRNGVMLFENAVARIGFAEFSAATPSPNTIEHNGANGILVTRSSTADVWGNIVRANAVAGVACDRASHAEVRANDISQNAGSAIAVSSGSGVNLGAGALQNSSSVSNTGFALSCAVGGYAAGRIGALVGSAGVKSITGGCSDATQ